MGLLPLEFTDGLTDSPDFRETLQAHERELDLTNTAIKHLIKDIKDLIAAAKHLSRAQRTLSDTLNNFNFQCIGNSQTDDEMVIANSFKDFARLLSTIEDERDRLLEKADEAFLEPIERFRREQIGSAKEAKKKFEKETAKYCQNLERYLNLSGKKSETQLWEADASNSMEQQHFFKAMSEYVLKLQEVNERKKFEFVETVLSFMLGWLTFYHQGHEIATDFYSVKMELQMRLQRTRNNFNMTQEETKSLRQKMLNNQEKFKQKFQDSTDQIYTREGYLFLMEKKAFTTSWTKHFCKYEKSTRRLTLIPFTQTAGKNISKEEKTCMNVKECIKRNQDTIDRRFCFDIVTGPLISIVDDHSSSSSHHTNTTNGPSSSKSHSPNIFSSSSSNDNNSSVVHTFQALSEEDYKCWLETLEARDPYPVAISNSKSGKHSSTKTNSNNNDNLKNHFLSGDGSGGAGGTNTSNFSDSYDLDAKGYWFIKKCIQSIESKGLDQKGIYRVVGVTSRVRLLMEMFSQSKSINSQSDNNDPNDQKYSRLDDIDLLPNLDFESDDFETKTITSALKSYLRNLNEPIMTFKLHSEFIAAAKLENRNLRIEKIHHLVHRLPPINFKILKILIEHLQKIAKLHDKNLMTSSNLGVCFGPTLLRTAEESVAAILDIKFVNVIAELLIENYEIFFLSKPTILINDTMPPSMVPTSSSSHLQNICNYYKVNNFNQIQQRPLPNVPVNQYQQGTNFNTTGTTNVVNRFLTLNNNNNENVRRSNSQDQLYTGIPSPSSSTTTSSALLSSSTARNKTIYNSPNNGVGSSGAMLSSPTSSTSSSMLQHPQHSKQSHQQYYSTTYPNYHQMQQSQNIPIGLSTSSSIAASRRPLRLSLSSSSPSPSLGSSAISTIATNTAVGTNQQSSPQQQNLSIYPSQIYPKQSHQGWTNNLVSQHQHHHQQMQPSVSYQNLHYNVEMSASSSGNNQTIGGVDSTNRSLNYQTSNHLLHNRPMTSIGIIPPNSTYCSLLRPSDADNAQHPQQQQNKIDLLTKLNPNINYMATSTPSTSLAVANNNCLASRTMNFSSSSSTSLPSTPENSQQQQQQQQQFQSSMMMPVISTAISGVKQATISSRSSNVATNLNSISPSTSNNKNNNNNINNISNNNEQNKHPIQTSLTGIESSTSSSSLYPTINQNIYQSIARSGQSIYGSIFGSSTQQQQQQHHRFLIGAMTPQTLPSTKVRTRYVCIGGSDSELSFQPNTIITNVRTSREPGWLEGNLNGKTGLIPLNYVEFIE